MAQAPPEFFSDDRPPGAPSRLESFDPVLLDKHLALAAVELPGPDYYTALSWIHDAIRSRTYIEIGVRSGASLAVAGADTHCIGVDPDPKVKGHMSGCIEIFSMKSDEFFSTHTCEQVFGTPRVDFAFIDGLHLFEQALRDFINLERLAGPTSVIAIHDCLPLDAITSQRIRSTFFYSGDVWKLAACLLKWRPDLHMGTIRTPPTGLCVITGLDRSSTVLERSYNELMAEYLHLDYEYYATHRGLLPEAIPNDKESVRTFLEGVAQDSTGPQS